MNQQGNIYKDTLHRVNRNPLSFSDSYDSYNHNYVCLTSQLSQTYTSADSHELPGTRVKSKDSSEICGSVGRARSAAKNVQRPRREKERVAIRFLAQF